MNPIITWYTALSASGFVSGNDFYAGTYNQTAPLSLSIEIWNNRWGTAAVNTLNNAVLNFSFADYEDSSLLSCCTVNIGSKQLPITIKNGIASANLGVSLSGAANDGDDSNAANATNFVSVVFQFNAGSYQIKNNDLKSLFFEVVSQN